MFNQAVRERITYPSQAWNKGVYGRVYVGFQIDRTGKVNNVTLLSPENGDYGFDYVVKQSVKKLPVLKPDYVGTYVLPVAFTLTNQLDGTKTLPVGTLSTGQVGDRVMLAEIKILFSTAKPIANAREVWGSGK